MTLNAADRRRMPRPTARAFLRGIGLVLVLFVGWPNEAQGTELQLPPVPRQELRIRAPSPQWNLGLVAGACGVGQRLWEGTDFCGGLVADVLFLRRRPSDGGLGGYVQLASSGFADFRGSAGMTGMIPLGRIFTLSARVGGLAVTFAEGAAPGIEGYLEFGLRSLNFSAGYSLTHTLVIGLQHTPGEGSRAGTNIWLAARIDAFWLVAPFGMLFR